MPMALSISLVLRQEASALPPAKALDYAGIGLAITLRVSLVAIWALVICVIKLLIVSVSVHNVISFS